MFAFIPKVTGLQGSPSLGPTGLPLGVALLAAPGGSSWDIWGALPQGCSSSWLRGRGGGLGGRAEDRALGALGCLGSPEPCRCSSTATRGSVNKRCRVDAPASHCASGGRGLPTGL